jgi:flagellar biogenesis protein FliO
MGRSPLRSEAGSPDHEQAKEAAMSVVSFALALPLVLLFVALLTYLLARALLLVGPPGAYRHRPPRGRHP